jgi:uncharacterized protein (DUF3084 family)
MAMQSIRHLSLLAVLCVALPANAQIYQWKDQNGKTVISDKPPNGSVQQKRQIDSGAPQTSPQQPSLADREREFRARQKEAREKAEQAQKEESAAAHKNEHCQNVRRHLKTLESGERIAARNDRGERYYLNDVQRTQEVEKIRRLIESHCLE